MSGVADFSHAFSKHRNEAGGSFKAPNDNRFGNPKAATFVGTAISKWITTSVKSLQNTFTKASAMNVDLSGWKVGKVTSLDGTFDGASKFAGTGLDSWDTSSVTRLASTFWDAREMNADLTGWKVDRVTSLHWTFYSASKFTGAGLDSWNTEAVKSLSDTFREAGEMNSDLSKWKTAQVVMLKNTFKSASKFTGAGVDLWDVSKVTDMDSTFSAATSLTACSKRKIADAWKSNSAFTDTNYDTDWADEICVLVLPAKEVKVRGYSDDEGA